MVFPENYPDELIKRYRLEGLPVLARARQARVPRRRRSTLSRGARPRGSARFHRPHHAPGHLRAISARAARRPEPGHRRHRSRRPRGVRRPPDRRLRTRRPPARRASDADTPTQRAKRYPHTNPTRKRGAHPSKSRESDQAIDLVTLIHPREVDRAAVRSLLAESIAACDAQQLAAFAEPLEGLRQAHPDDLSVAIASALVTPRVRRFQPHRTGPGTIERPRRQVTARAAAGRHARQRTSACRGRPAGPALAGRARLYPSLRPPRSTRSATDWPPGPSMRPPAQTDSALAPGDAPRARPARVRPRRPSRGRSRVGPDVEHAAGPRAVANSPPRHQPAPIGGDAHAAAGFGAGGDARATDGRLSLSRRRKTRPAGGAQSVSNHASRLPSAAAYLRNVPTVGLGISPRSSVEILARSMLVRS